MTNNVFSAAASKAAALSAILCRNLKSVRRVDFEAENQLQNAIECLQHTLCTLWEEFEDDESTKSWRRRPPQHDKHE